VKRLLRLAAVQWLLASVVVAYVRILIATMRWEVENRETVDAAVSSTSGAVALFWHGRISMAAVCADLLGDKARRVMISLSRDGDFISMAAERLGVPVIRGSTGKGPLVAAKGGGAAFRQAVAFLRGGGALLLTPDGPRGPCGTLSPGAVRLAAAAGVPVFLVGLAARPSIPLRSWDGGELPLPFARGRLVVDGPLAAPSSGDAAGLERLRADWQGRMTQAQIRAETEDDGRDGGPPRGNLALGLSLYRLATRMVSPLAPALLALRALSGREDKERRGERLGRASRGRPVGRLVWLHGASVGETLSLLPLIEAIAQAAPEQALLVTSGTRTSANLLASRLPSGIIHQYAPMDTPAAAARFLDHWRPELVIFTESELWPNLLVGAKNRGAALALVSARMSRASFRRWLWAPQTARTLVGAFDLIVARDEEQAQRFAKLGGEVAAVADMKSAGEPLPADEDALKRLRAEIGDRAVVLAASTHPGEEAMVLEAWRAAIRGRPPNSALLIIAPRHPRRGAEIMRLAQRAGLRPSLRTAATALADLEVYVADTIGELGLFYRLGALAFIGGSLISTGGGHNPLEAARLGCPFVSGPGLENWPVYRELQNLGGTKCVTPDQLTAVFAEALNDPSSYAEMAARAQAFARERDREAQAGIDRVLELLRR